MRDTLIFKLEDLACLAANWNLELGLFTINGGYLYLGAESSLSEVDWQLVDDVIAIPLEKLMLFHC